MAEVWEFAQFPEYKIHITLYKDLQNAGFLRQQLLSGNAEFEYAFIDATIILSRRHVLAAAFRALNDSRLGKLRSRNVHSEIVFSLSPNNNIAESFQRFGITLQTKSLLAIKVIRKADNSAGADVITNHITKNISGSVLPFKDEVLRNLRDTKRIKKVYKLGGNSHVTSNASSNDSYDSAIDDEEATILGLMALRGS